MTARIMSNKVNGKTTILFTANGNTTIVVAGNNTVSNLTANASEVVSSATIRKISWGATSSQMILIYRAANLVLSVSGAGEKDLSGIPQNLDATANIVVTLPDANATLIMEVGKNFAVMSNQGY